MENRACRVEGGIADDRGVGKSAMCSTRPVLTIFSRALRGGHRHKTRLTHLRTRTSGAVQLAAMMITATATRARWAARNTSEGKSKLAIGHACHREPPAAISALINPERRAAGSGPGRLSQAHPMEGTVGLGRAAISMLRRSVFAMRWNPDILSRRHR
jgi:hypothetical protein